MRECYRGSPLHPKERTERKRWDTPPREATETYGMILCPTFFQLIAIATISHFPTGRQLTHKVPSSCPLNNLRRLFSGGNFSRRDGVFDAVWIERIKAPCGCLGLGIHEEWYFRANGARKRYVMCKIVGQPISFPGAQ